MTDFERFDKVWNGEFQAAKLLGREKRQTIRGHKTQERYENVLFSIWKHHNDWDDAHGFEIKCFKQNVIYRVVRLAEEAGLLVKTRNYYAGDHTNEYHKNNILFDLAFRGKDNKFGKWLNELDVNKDKDVIHKLYLDEFNSINKLDNNKYNKPYVITSSGSNRLERKLLKLNYDLGLLYNISDKMLDYYYNLLLELNKAAIHDDLKFFTFLKYDKDGFPTGRPYSHFCSTGNDKKTHKDNSLELRSDFLKRIGLSDYYEVYDIKSEVPRVNYLFHTGEWKPDNYDFYTEIIKDTEMISYVDWQVERGQTKYTDYEDSMKQLFMRIYFGKGSDRQSFSGWLNDKLKRLDKNYIDYWIKENEGFEINFDIWKVLCNSTRKVIGPSLGNLVFWYTFFIETEVKIELLKRGKTVYNVYDGFYYNQDIKTEIEDILVQKAKFVYDNYMAPIKVVNNRPTLLANNRTKAMYTKLDNKEYNIKLDDNM